MKVLHIQKGTREVPEDPGLSTRNQRKPVLTCSLLKLRLACILTELQKHFHTSDILQGFCS